MSKTRTEVLDESKKKGVVAAVATGGAVAVGALLSPVVGVAVAPVGMYFAYKWWKHRAENGIRF